MCRVSIFSIPIREMKKADLQGRHIIPTGRQTFTSKQKTLQCGLMTTENEEDNIISKERKHGMKI